MSVRQMTHIACMVAVDVTKYNKEDVRTMIEETSCHTVYEFFDTYRNMFGVDVNNQINYCKEIRKEMEE